MCKVVATQPGFQNQTLREVGEVFDLLAHEDGTYPVAIRYLPKKDASGVAIPDEFIEEIVKGKDGKPLHRDFAEDTGDQLIKRGPKRGEVMRFGWMKRVPDKTPVGLYKPGTDFWSNQQLPPPVLREGGAPPDPRRIHAPVLTVLPKDEAEAA